MFISLLAVLCLCSFESFVCRCGCFAPLSYFVLVLHCFVALLHLSVVILCLIVAVLSLLVGVLHQSRKCGLLHLLYQEKGLGLSASQIMTNTACDAFC